MLKYFLLFSVILFFVVSAKDSCVQLSNRSTSGRVTIKKFLKTVEKYDVVVVGHAQCYFTRSTVDALNRDRKMKGRCAYFFYDEYANDSWLAGVWYLVDKSGRSDPSRLPFGFVCGEFVGGKEAVLRKRNKKC